MAKKPDTKFIPLQKRIAMGEKIEFPKKKK
jgi:hypothetical protein